MSSSGPSHTTNGVHRRKASREEDENVLVFTLDEPGTPSLSLDKPPRGNRDESSATSSGHGQEASSSRSLDGGKTSPKANGTEHGGWGMRSQGASQRSRVTSVPAVSSPLNGQFPPSHSHPPSPPSAGPFRTSFAVPRPPVTNGTYSHSNAPNGHRHQHQAPAMRQSLSLPGHSSHARARSVSGPFSPSSPSPLATSFSISQSASYPQGSDSHGFAPYPGPSSDELAGSPPKGRTTFNFGNGNGVSPLPPPNTQAHGRRHSRLHSRNLSIFFPRPGSLPSTTIDEDADQEVAFTPSQSYSSDDGAGVLMPSASSPGPGQRSFKEGFTFGARPPSSTSDSGLPSAGSAHPSGPSRRGHHHKHSMSHNFFSFLEPGGSPADLHTQPTPMPVSPWNPISPFPFEKSTSASSLDYTSPVEGTNGIGLGVQTAEKPGERYIQQPPEIDPLAVVAAIWQFVLGASLWVVGQQVGSLSCTGLGYLVVSDAFGVGLARVLPGYLARPSSGSGMNRPYGDSRLETLMTYAQSVYLLFASVYVCKETVEHLLLSSGEGHHHHHGDEIAFIVGIDFPPLLLSIALLSLTCTAIIFNSQAKLVSATGNYIPPLYSLLPFRLRLYISGKPTYPPLIANLLSNPYTLAPIIFCSSILCAYAILPPHQHSSFDLLLAAVETVVTFALAYPAAVALGAVLLQTAPPRGLPGGRMEAFLRVMREIERHPKVLHLPAPHFWQLTAPQSRPDYIRASTPWEGPAQSLVVTLELHVRRDIADDEVLELTAWAAKQVRTALRYGSREGGGESEADITVGVVKG